MKIKNIRSRFRVAGFFVLCIVLTGCAGRKAEFLVEEKREADVVETLGEGEETQVTGEPETAELLPEVTTPPAEIYVDVCGAVAEPGVFKLMEGSRVFQAIEAAGGYLPEAAEGSVNRAGFLTDGQQIYVPTKEEMEEAAFSGAESAWEKQGEGALTADGTDGKVNLNTADEAALTTLTGIGATRAQAILSYREENGPFRTIEEIMNVQGIKEGTFEKIKDEITVQ